jgi:hypothetical protein
VSESRSAPAPAPGPRAVDDGLPLDADGLDADGRTALLEAIRRERLAPGEPDALRSPWWLAGLEQAVDRTP